MPTYTFINTETNEEFEMVFSSFSKKDSYLEQNPTIKQTITSPPGLGDPIRLGIRKPDDAFRDKLKDIKRTHRGSTVNTF